MKVAQPISKTLGQWCLFPQIQELFLLSPNFRPWMSSLSPLPLHPHHFLLVWQNRKTQPDDIRTDSFSPHLPKFLFLFKASHVPPRWSTKSPQHGDAFWLWVKVVLLVSPASQEEDSEKARGSEITCKQAESERNSGSFTKESILLTNIPRRLTTFNIKRPRKWAHSGLRAWTGVNPTCQSTSTY